MKIKIEKVRKIKKTVHVVGAIIENEKKKFFVRYEDQK